jgi:hypothetical protein
VAAHPIRAGRMHATCLLRSIGVVVFWYAAAFGGLLLLAVSFAPPAGSILLLAVCFVVAIQTIAAGHYGRRAAEPWYTWAAVHGFFSHGSGFLLVVVLVGSSTVVFPEPPGLGVPDPVGPNVRVIAFGSIAYSAFSVVWTLALGWLARRLWGAVDPEAPVISLRPRSSRTSA